MECVHESGSTPYYNSTRLHSYNDYRSPNEAEADWRGKKKAA